VSRPVIGTSPLTPQDDENESRDCDRHPGHAAQRLHARDDFSPLVALPERKEKNPQHNSEIGGTDRAKGGESNTEEEHHPNQWETLV